MQVVAVRHDSRINYPPLDEHSPGRTFSRISFQGIVLLGESCVRSRSSVPQGCGRRCRERWDPIPNPLGEWIEPGSRVFVLPNLVVSKRSGEAQKDFFGQMHSRLNSPGGLGLFDDCDGFSGARLVWQRPTSIL